MSQSDRNSKKDNKSGGNEPSFNWRGVVLIAIAFALIGARRSLPRRRLHQRRRRAVQPLPRAAREQADRHRQKLPAPARRRGRPANPDAARRITSSRASGPTPSQQVRVPHDGLPELQHESPGAARRGRHPAGDQDGVERPARRRWSASCRSRSSSSSSICSSASRSAWPAKAR